MDVRYAAPGELPDECPFEGGSVERYELVVYAWDTEVGRVWGAGLSLGEVFAPMNG